MANRLIGGVLSSKQPQSSGFVSRASTGTHFNQTGTLVTAPINQPRVNYTFSGNPIGTRYSTSFNGSAYLTAPYGSNFNFGTGNFTVEGWIYLNSLASSYYVMAGTWTTGTTDEWLIQIQNNNSIRFLTTTGTTFYSTTISVGQWYHIAGVRNGSTITLYVNGTSVGSYTNANSIGSVSKVTYIGAQQSPIWYVNGFISNFRITNGVAVYTGNFTVPTSPLTSTQSSGTNISAITGTQTALLTCQNNTFIDNSTNAVVLTNSSATVSTFLPPIYPSDFSGTGWSNPTTLIEPASTNIITYSEQIDNAVWSKIALGSRTGITANAATAPDGNTTADLVYVVNGQTSVSGGAYWPYTFTNGVTYTWSCFFKYVGYQYVFMGTDNNNASCVWFDLSAGTVGSTSTGFRGTITNVGNGWYRCATTFTFASASMGNAGPIMGCANVNGSVTLTQAGNGSTGVYMWGAQLEINSLGATSYIPTTGAAVTRAQDTTGVVGSGVYTLAQLENQTSIDDQFTVQSFPNVGSNYNWTCPEDVTSVEVLVVAGGGGGGNAQGGGSGGGAGGLLYNASYPVVPGTTYPIVVGAGGAGAATGLTAAGTNGQNSQFGNLIAIGGGAGSAEYVNGINGRTGGSGGGNHYSTATAGAPGITGQGFPGGVSSSVNGSGYEAGGGGGGAGGPGGVGINTGTASTSVGGSGGPGLYFNISGTNTVYAGGGGGATNVNATGVSVGGSGIGGGGGRRTSTNGGVGAVNTGSGGGGGGTDASSSGAGGSGVVVVKYKRTNRQLAVVSNASVVVQKFNSTNLWTVPVGVTQVEALVVAGGGGGGNGTGGGGGGAGGVVYSSAVTVTPGSTYTIGVGGGGTGSTTNGGTVSAQNGLGSGIGTGTELITNGSAFTVTTGWTATTATLSVPSTGTFRILPNAAVNGSASQTITTVIGTTYIVVVKVISDVAKQFRLFAGSSQFGQQNATFFTTYTRDSLDNGVSGAGFYSTTFTATSTTTWIDLQIGGGTQQATDISYISVRQATLSTSGGGFGGSESPTAGYRVGGPGGSGGGGKYSDSGGTGIAGQGNAGGAGIVTSGGGGSATWTGGGGGGAGAPGSTSTTYYAGNGGAGVAYAITGNLEYYGGGGGGSSQNYNLGTVYPGLGGIGGGGTGFADQNSSTVGKGQNGASNTGGGGGGQADAPGSENSGHGGSGVVILRYRVPQIATFLDSGAWTCPSGVTSVQALVVAGGGGGGSDLGGGGGAGGVVYSTSVAVTPGQTYPIVVGQGGTTTADAGNNGQNSNFANIIAVGGGGGGSGISTNAGRAGGSGGGARVNRTNQPGGSGTYGQGNAGGGALQLAAGTGYGASGGGGGAGSPGAAGSQTAEGSAGTGDGGVGLAYSISGSSTYYGGGGGSCSVLGTSYIPAGGLGGGAAGIRAGSSTPGNNATPNTGGGGGGGGNGYTGGAGSVGGSGIVIIRWYGG